MSWAEIKKAVNSDIEVPLDKGIGEYYLNRKKIKEIKHIPHFSVPRITFSVGNVTTAAEMNNDLFVIGGSSLYSLQGNLSSLISSQLRGFKGSYETDNGMYLTTSNYGYTGTLVETDNSVYFVGNACTQQSPDSSAYISELQVYKVRSNDSFSAEYLNYIGSTLGSTSKYVVGSAVVGYKNNIYIFEGYGYNDHQMTSTGSNVVATYIYDTETNTFERLGDVPYNANDALAVLLSDGIHIIGGYSSAPYANAKYYRDYHYVFDIETKTFQQLPFIPSTLGITHVTRYDAKCININDELHCFSGEKHVKWNGTNWVSCKDFSDLFPKYSVGLSTKSFDNTLVFKFNGQYYMSNSIFRSIYKYDPTNDKLTPEIVCDSVHTVVVFDDDTTSF